jgi:hypothetical protein
MAALADVLSSVTSGMTIRPAVWRRSLPQKLHFSCVACAGRGFIVPSSVPAGSPEPITTPARAMQGSQMYTPGPAISLRTSFCCLPQNEQASSTGSGRLRGVPARTQRREPPASSTIWCTR